MADDTACLQAALDAGATQNRQIHIPAGTYMVSQSLLIKGSNSSTSTPYYHAPVFGDGKSSSILKASPSGRWTTATNSSNLAVLLFPSCCGALPQSGSGFYVRDLSIQANSVVDYGVLAPAVQSSLFQRLYVTGARVGGGSIGWGWCNMVEDCEFESNYIGLIIKNADNNVNIVNCAMLDNEVGLYLLR